MWPETVPDPGASEPASPFPFPVLIGDIGGTYTRFAVLGNPGEPPSRLVTTPTALHASPSAAIRSAVEMLGGRPPRSALLGIAGRVDAPVVRLTNAPWTVDAARIGSDLNLSRVLLVNDYVPVAAALPAFDAERPGDLVRIGPALPCGRGARLALGPGTGLGVAACIPVRGRYWLQPTEAGHVDFGACEADEFAIWPLIERIDGRIAAETVLSGPGMLRLYYAVARHMGDLPACRIPADVVAAAHSGLDRAASEALRLFASLLGRFAGDLALVFGASGGVFLGSGIPPRIAPILNGGVFRAAFERKQPFGAAMHGIPTFIITHPEPGMTGLASIASAPDRFLFDAQTWTAPTAARSQDDPPDGAP